VIDHYGNSNNSKNWHRRTTRSSCLGYLQVCWRRCIQIPFLVSQSEKQASSACFITNRHGYQDSSFYYGHYTDLNHTTGSNTEVDILHTAEQEKIGAPPGNGNPGSQDHAARIAHFISQTVTPSPIPPTLSGTDIEKSTADPSA
jgi:hypothetical protein